jgi:hypothetical protein
MHDVALGAGQADVSQKRSASLRTGVKDVGSSSNGIKLNPKQSQNREVVEL